MTYNRLPSLFNKKKTSHLKCMPIGNLQAVRRIDRSIICKILTSSDEYCYHTRYIAISTAKYNLTVKHSQFKPNHENNKHEQYNDQQIGWLTSYFQATMLLINLYAMIQVPCEFWVATKSSSSLRLQLNVRGMFLNVVAKYSCSVYLHVLQWETMEIPTTWYSAFLISGRHWTVDHFNM